MRSRSVGRDTSLMTKTYDAIVVGARCAGSPTAMLLARKGYRVLLVDKATFPSDTISTHFFRGAGLWPASRRGSHARVRAHRRRRQGSVAALTSALEARS
jgi:2-polyprenyl-6-methoxyphenol hydroxylase-like FAD-dependent oxidoreductase